MTVIKESNEYEDGLSSGTDINALQNEIQADFEQGNQSELIL